MDYYQQSKNRFLLYVFNYTSLNAVLSLIGIAFGYSYYKLAYHGESYLSKFWGFLFVS